MHRSAGMRRLAAAISEIGRAPSGHVSADRPLAKTETTSVVNARTVGILLLVFSFLLAAGADLMQVPVPGMATVILAVVAGALITSGS